MSQRFTKLKVWNEAHQLVIRTYKLSYSFPAEEKFCLTSQIRRSATSICANLAEGCERKSIKEYLQYMYISKGSLGETRYHMLLAKDLGYLKKEEFLSFEEQADYIAALLQKLIRSMERTN